MASTTDTRTPPFELSAVVDPYEDWFHTPYGRFVDRIERELLLELLAPLPSGANVLDIGCGTGWFGARLRERGLSVTGVDSSLLMLSRARDRMPVVRASALQLPFADRSFDAAYLTAVLDFVPDPVLVLREARRVVRDRLAVIALASGSWLGLRRRISGDLGHPIFSQARFYSRRRLIEMARASGAEPERLRGALFLPPSLGPRLPALERFLRQRIVAGAGIVGFALPPLQDDSEVGGSSH